MFELKKTIITSSGTAPTNASVKNEATPSLIYDYSISYDVGFWVLFLFFVVISEFKSLSNAIKSNIWFWLIILYVLHAINIGNAWYVEDIIIKKILNKQTILLFFFPPNYVFILIMLCFHTIKAFSLCFTFMQLKFIKLFISFKKM